MQGDDSVMLSDVQTTCDERMSFISQRRQFEAPNMEGM